VKRVHVGAGVLALVLGIATPVAAEVGLPPLGSAAPSDDLIVPTIGQSVSIPDVVTWMQAAITARTTEVDQLLAQLKASTSLPSGVRYRASAIVRRANDSLSSLAVTVPSDTELRAVRSDVSAIVGLHIFSVLQPQVSEVLAVESAKSTVRQLLNQEASIRAAVAASKSAHLPVATASALLVRFDTDLTSAKGLLAPLTSTLLSVGSVGVTKATSTLATATAAISTAGALVAQAKVAEHSIVTSLSAKATISRPA
jgi:hypothetical protein